MAATVRYGALTEFYYFMHQRSSQSPASPGLSLKLLRNALDSRDEGMLAALLGSGVLHQPLDPDEWQLRGLSGDLLRKAMDLGDEGMLAVLLGSRVLHQLVDLDGRHLSHAVQMHSRHAGVVRVLLQRGVTAGLEHVNMAIGCGNRAALEVLLHFGQPTVPLGRKEAPVSWGWGNTMCPLIT